MRIAQLLDGLTIALTNEEQQFLKKHNSAIRLNSLDERGRLLAHNLVRKGIYAISNDNQTLINQCNDSSALSSTKTIF